MTQSAFAHLNYCQISWSLKRVFTM